MVACQHHRAADPAAMKLADHACAFFTNLVGDSEHPQHFVFVGQ
jgi:hypothetical protein